jgi:hypothetical protein
MKLKVHAVFPIPALTDIRQKKDKREMEMPQIGFLWLVIVRDALQDKMIYGNFKKQEIK